VSVWLALLLGIVEGLTEFLPISSTGHLILTGHLAGLENGPRAVVFQIFIQLGAMLAVLVEYRVRLLAVARGFGSDAAARGFVFKLAGAFVPAAAIGFFAHEAIMASLFSPRAVAAALIAGAVLIFVVEALPLAPRTTVAEELSWGQALAIGAAQCVALWPGFSRSAATILGGMGAGLDRKAATEFSFLLALPTLGAATVYSLLKNFRALAAGDPGYLAIAFLVSFGVAWLSIRWLLRFVSTHTFRPFAWYRIALGLVVLYFL
jgi:undecaprenyl-diphosphatase